MLEALRHGGYTLGGEQSGHVLLPEYATTGDGMLTALHLMARMAATGKSLAELASVLVKLPQVLVNVPVGGPVRGLAPRRTCWPPSGSPRPSWASRAGCCCARPVPSSWSG